MEPNTLEDYFILTGMKPEKLYTKDEAEGIINEHAVSIYKGQLLLAEDRPFTGQEIAEKLYGLEHAWEQLAEKLMEPVTTGE